ncbi:uncharacterized protein EDD25_2996 [Cryobacterium psychrophilum]|uniref:DUF177 domain-containing protein n=1 Tax=Cryobacterium psychrophilum TaxID=41988 RepID=A0A4Y8KRH7_9MICO|nr:uncharacterized protein EDD25_2996 [Cryobacterium psychrophilum]TFD78514.1 DUF177 domain-containing protein [Cryobacterium psychrophilum]
MGLVTKFKKTPYTVDVRDLINRPGTMHERHLDIVVPEELGAGLVSVRAGSTVGVDLRLEAMHEGILATTTVVAPASGECGRCLTDIEFRVRVEFTELFGYPQEEAFEFEVVDDHIDIESLVRDAVVMSLPFQPLCRRDCAGLDPETGQRLTEPPELEPIEAFDPRWSALAGFQASTDISTDDDIQAETHREEK